MQNLMIYYKKQDEIKTLSKELASFDITKLKKVIIPQEDKQKEDKFYTELKEFDIDKLKKVEHKEKEIMETEHKLTKINNELKKVHSKKYLRNTKNRNSKKNR